MRSPLAEHQRATLIEAILPNVAFDGWSRPALRAAAQAILGADVYHTEDIYLRVAAVAGQGGVQRPGRRARL